MENYTISFKGMSGNDPDLIVTQAELERLLNESLVRVQGEKVRSVLLQELVKFHSPVVEDLAEDAPDE